MRVIEPSVEIMRTGLETEFCTPEQFIEKVGRTCYKSEDKITDTSAAKFVSGLVSRGHEAMIEHWNLVFETDIETYYEILYDWEALLQGTDTLTKDRLRPFLRFTRHEFIDRPPRFIVSGNMRAWRDYAKFCITELSSLPIYMHGMVRNYPIFFPEYQDYVPPIINNFYLIPIDISELTKPERQVHQNVTVKFICDRGVSHEIVRHRVASFAQESTRYCNYSQDKFGGEITVIRPSWCKREDPIYDTWRDAMCQAEGNYFLMLSEGATPQDARSALPNSLKTEIIVTMNLDGWDHFFGLRCSNNAHPDIREVAFMTLQMFEHESI